MTPTDLDELEEAERAERAATEVSCGFCDATSCNGHNLVDVNDPAAFWRSLTPSQCLALLQCAPRVAGPWRDEPEAAFPNAMARRTADGECVADVFRESKTAQAVWICSGIGHGDAPSMEAGRAAADAALIAAGWLLAAPEGE